MATYLNDHLAASVGAIELLERLSKAYEKQSVGRFSQEIKADIEKDQDELRKIMNAVGVAESKARQAGAWIGEKFSRIKLRLEGEGTGDPGVMMSLEGMALGVKGKELLWQALAAVQPTWPELKDFDFTRLQQRAVDQGKLINKQRLLSATEILSLRPAGTE